MTNVFYSQCNFVYKFFAITVLLSLTPLLNVFAQISITSGGTPAQIIERLTGQGVKIQNVVVTGSSSAYGLYQTSSNAGELGILKVGKGVVMASGNVSAIRNMASGFASTSLGRGGDATLTALAGVPTYDAVTIEFEVIPSGNTLSFEYTFGSEEYPEYAPPITYSFNDVFGFFISGPGIVGEKNIALLPNSNTIVAINSVNPAANSTYYYNNALGNHLVYDGFIRNLSAVATNLQPCQVYKIKLKIADGGDGVFDSGVLIEQVSSKSMEAEDLACNKLTITRPNSISTQQIGLSYAGSAITNNVVTGLPTSTTILAGNTSVEIPFTPNYANVVGIKNTLITYFSEICNGTVFDTVTVDIYKPIDLGMPTQYICRGSNITLNAGAGYPNYQWSTGATTQQINVNQDGLYIVKSLYGKGCITTDTVEVKFIPDPIDLVPVSKDTAFCQSGTAIIKIPNSQLGYKYQLYNHLTSTLVGAELVGTGDTLVLTSPLVTQSTTFKVQVTTNTSPICSKFLSNDIKIIIHPLPALTTSGNTSICIGNSSTLTVSGAAQYTWSPSIGLSQTTGNSVTANPTVTTTYTITGTSTKGCVNTTTITVNVVDRPIANFTQSLSDFCATMPLVTLTNNSSTAVGTTYLWDFGNGQTSNDLTPAPFRYAAAGTYTITLTVRNANGCEQVTSQNITITAGTPIVSTISPTQRTCEGNSVQLQATGGTTYTWTPITGLNNPNIANPIANPSTTTTYSVVISNGVCQKTETVLVEIDEKPIADFAKSLSDPCAIMPLVTLSNNSTVTVGTTYLWDFGNGQTSTDLTPAPFRYATAGTYTITLTVRNANGCEKTSSQNITITAGTPIISTISPTQRTCVGNSVQLQATGGTTYTWTPTTGLNNANIANPIANPSVTTTYSVVIANGACQKTETVTVEVNERPTATFTHTFAEPCATLPLVTLTNNSSTTAGTTYFWDFGNGQTSTDLTPTPFRYATAGTYTISLTVRNANGCENSMVKNIVITPNPIASANAVGSQVICIGERTQLSASGGTTYSWTPATGLDNPNIPNPIASPSVSTTYTVRISDALGCFKEIPVTVGVETLPAAKFSLQQSDSCSTFPLITLHNEAANATSFWWDFGNGTGSAAKNPVVRYTAEGNYTIRLYAYNGQSCRSSAEKTVQIRRNAVIYATLQPIKTICKGGTVQLQASGGTSYRWSPAEGLSNANIANPIASPSQTTTYSVRIFNQFNCSKDTSITVNVVPTIVANFGIFLSDSCNKFPTVNIQSLATTAPNITYTWDFGNGQGSNLAQPPSFTYNAEGTYTITLTVNNGVCSRSKTYQLVYKENPDFDFYTRIGVSSTQNLCVGEKVQLQATGGTSYSWTPTTGLNNPLISNPLASPTVTTRYHVRIINSVGCYRDTSILVNVYPPIQADFGVVLEENCDQEYPLVKLSPTLLNGTVYQWDLGNGQTYIGENPPAFRYETAGLFTIKLKAINQACSREVVRTVKIDKNDINFYKNITLQPEKPAICQNTSMQLEAKGGVKYLWTPSTGLSNANIANPIANPTTTTRYNVRIFNAKGCFRDTSIVVTVVPDIQPDFEVQITSECGSSAKVSFVNKTTGTGEYKWKLGNGEEFSTANIGSYEYPNAGEYEVILEVFNGVCRKTKTHKIQVENLKNSNVVTPNGDGKNERFVIDKVREGWKIEIYDRYGNVQFKSDNYQNDWGDVEVATYFYLLTSPEGKTCKGWVQVLKD
jgi:gliding motility-associated-like protein